MLYLRVGVARGRFVIPGRSIREVIPTVPLHRTVDLPAGVAGVMNYRGQPLVVVDLGPLLAGEPTPDQFSSRIVVCWSGAAEVGTAALFGLLVAEAFETADLECTAFTAPLVERPAGVLWAGVRIGSAGAVEQLLDPNQLTNLVPELCV